MNSSGIMAEIQCMTAPEHVLRLPHGGVLAMGGGARALVMGILNVTPDSFSDGGLCRDTAAALAHAEEMAAEGADLIDIGGESTRPGSDPVSIEEQIARVAPVIEKLAPKITQPISVDTTSATVARRALDAGAQIVNDVSALRADPQMGPTIAEAGAPVVLMHMLGAPKTMQANPEYGDVVGEVRVFLRERIAAAEACGIRREQIMIDPGFGFGKTLEHNLELLRRLSEFSELNAPVLVGTSRKSMIGMILAVGPQERMFGTAATLAVAIERGAAMVRVHDVAAAVHVVKVMAAVPRRSWK